MKSFDAFCLLSLGVLLGNQLPRDGMILLPIAVGSVLLVRVIWSALRPPHPPHPPNLNRGNKPSND